MSSLRLSSADLFLTPSVFLLTYPAQLSLFLTVPPTYPPLASSTLQYLQSVSLTFKQREFLYCCTGSLFQKKRGKHADPSATLRLVSSCWCKFGGCYVGGSTKFRLEHKFKLRSTANQENTVMRYENTLAVHQVCCMF